MLVTDRDEYIEQLDTKLARIDREAQKWLKDAHRPKEQQLQINILRKQIARLRADLKNKSNVPEQQWDDAKASLERAWDDTKIAYNSLLRNFS